jgi:hypothetical protein
VPKLTCFHEPVRQCTAYAEKRGGLGHGSHESVALYSPRNGFLATSR